MALTLDELKKLHDKAYNHNQVTRERASDDLVFYWVTQWDDNSLADSQLAYRGEFNLLRKAGRGIMADLASNPIQVDFEPVDETRDDSAELVDGLYRADDNKNFSQESYNNAKSETVVCGFGAWELYTDYESRITGDNKQIIKRKPIPEANNTVFWDPNSKFIDRHDAGYVSTLYAYSEDGYKDLCESLTGEDKEDIVESNFKSPEHSYVFPWIGGEGHKVYVSRFYHRELVEESLYTLESPLGDQIQFSERELKDEDEDLANSGYDIVSEKIVERYRVTLYIASGEEILNGEVDEETGERTGEVIAGEHIPVIPMYGEHAYIEGEEHWEGVTRLAKDPQRLRNFQLSYLADIVSRSPREKPIMTQEQIAGHEDMYSLTGSENNYPVLYQNRVDDEGLELPMGPVGYIKSPDIPPALAAMTDLSRQAIEDVATPGIPADIADVDLSGKAVVALTARLDMQSMIFQENFKHAKRRDAQVWASMAIEIIDVPRKVKIELPDGTKKTVQVMETILNDDGDLVVLNDLSNAEFEVYGKIGPSYASQKEQTLERVEKMIQTLPPGHPMVEMLLLKQVQLTDGTDFEDLRDYTNQQLVLKGIRKPETPEEEEMLAQAQSQAPEPSPEMVLAQAEMLKGQAANKEADLKVFVAQNNAQNEQAKRTVDGFNAETSRMDTQIDAQEAGAKINRTNIEAFGEQLDNQMKVVELQKPKAIPEMDDDELYQMISG
jgi:hypothetical protein